MSKRNRNSKKNAPAAASGNGGSQTVVDGNAVGVAPDGEAATTTEQPSDDEVLAALEAADTVEATEQTEPAGDTESPFTEVVDTSTEVVTETAEEVEVEIEAEDEDAVLAALEAEEDDSAPADKPKSKKKAAAPAQPVVTRQFCDVADHMDDKALKTALDGITAKKVAEKASNVVQAITTGKKLSGFTALAIKLLTEQGHVTSKELVEAYQKDGKSLGTARAQAQQQTALFKALSIATPDATDAKKLVACDNGLVKELAVLAAA